MKCSKTLLIVALSLAIVLLFSCSASAPTPSFNVTYLGPDGKVILTHEVEEGKTAEEPEAGELPQNGEYYWSLTEDGDIYDFTTPVLGDITLYPIEKSKRVNVTFYYYGEDTPITSKLCKVGAKVSISDIGFNDKIFVIRELTDKDSGKEFDEKLSNKADGYKLQCKIGSDLLKISSGTIKGTDDLRAMKGSYTLNIPKYLEGEEVRAIGEGAFSSKDGEKAYSFDKLVLPDSISSIGKRAFMNCKSLTEVSFPRGVSNISDYTFAGCSSLKSFSFTMEVSSIGEGAFTLCTSLSEISIPGNVKSIGDKAFEGCSNLAKVTLSNGIESIGESAFASCVKLPTVFIPNSVSRIDFDAFYDCAIMKEIIIDKDDHLSLPGAIPWGGYEFYDKDKKARSCKYFKFTLKNTKGDIFLIAYYDGDKKHQVLRYQY